jgi:2-oxoglutarate ferredoxin oxidoreductase subunit alpha
MRNSEITIGVGGAAGDGQASIGDTLAKTCARLGLHIFVYNSYQSVIRGGHVWLRLRASERKVYSHGDHLDAVIALNQDCLDRHAAEVDEGGVVIFNGDKLTLEAGRLKPKVRSIPLPVAELMAPFGRQPAVMQNTVALGALTHLADLDFDFLKGVIRELFQRKGEEVINTNVGLAQAGFDYAAAHCAQMGYAWKFTGKHRAVLSGNEAFGIGAVAAGCTFYAAYPMTPASSILHFMANHAEKYGIVVKQVEDEIGVLNMAIGAGHAGARALVATSGGGFSLMTEAIGLAGMTETPVVIINSMRGGPSTGLPTKTEQGDLNQVFGASQGEYPRMIAAPSDPVDAFCTMVEAFNIAEKYQVPAIVVSDLLLSEHRETVDPEQFDFEAPIVR